MSRIGKAAIHLPEGVKVEHKGRALTCSGPKGALSCQLTDEVRLVERDGAILIEPVESSRTAKAHWGLTRSLIANMVAGVSKGWTKELEIRGVGYRAAMQGRVLKLNLGYSHDIDYDPPEGVEIKCARPTSISISGADKQKVGQVAAEIRAIRPPEPYKGKGVRYVDEYVMQKEGKKK